MYTQELEHVEGLPGVLGVRASGSAWVRGLMMICRVQGQRVSLAAWGRSVLSKGACGGPVGCLVWLEGVERFECAPSMLLVMASIFWIALLLLRGLLGWLAT